MNEFEVRVGAVPFLSDFLPGLRYSGGLSFTIDGAIVSTANAAAPSSSSDYDDAAEWELHMDTVEIKGSNVPILRNLLDSENVALRSRDLSKVLEDNVDGYEVPKPVLRTTYVDDGMRIVTLASLHSWSVSTTQWRRFICNAMIYSERITTTYSTIIDFLRDALIK